MSLTRIRCYTRTYFTQGYLSKFRYSNIENFLRCFTFKSANMRENSEQSKSDTADSTSTSPKTQKKEELPELDAAHKNEVLIPENFSDMERQIFFAHKNAVEVE